MGAGLTLHGGFVEQLGGGSVLAAALNNLPAAAAVHAIGATGRWAAILAMAIGSNLLVTGSVAALWGASIPITTLTCEFADPMIVAPHCQAEG